MLEKARNPETLPQLLRVPSWPIPQLPRCPHKNSQAWSLWRLESLLTPKMKCIRIGSVVSETTRT